MDATYSKPWWTQSYLVEEPSERDDHNLLMKHIRTSSAGPSVRRQTDKDFFKGNTADKMDYIFKLEKKVKKERKKRVSAENLLSTPIKGKRNLNASAKSPQAKLPW